MIEEENVVLSNSKSLIEQAGCGVLSDRRQYWIFRLSFNSYAQSLMLTLSIILDLDSRAYLSSKNINIKNKINYFCQPYRQNIRYKDNLITHNYVNIDGSLTVY